jgi:hypothetical protein
MPLKMHGRVETGMPKPVKATQWFNKPLSLPKLCQSQPKLCQSFAKVSQRFAKALPKSSKALPKLCQSQPKQLSGLINH